MLRFFRSPKHITIVVILLIGILTWLQALDYPEKAVSGKYGTFIFNALSGWLTNMPEVQVALGLVLFLLAAVLLIFVNARLHFIDKFSYVPVLCYVLLIGGAPETHLLSPELFATVILIAGFILLVGSFESEELSYSFFYVPAMISFATFFYQYMYVYMLVVWFIIAFWRPGYWREWVFSILGFALPMFFAFSWFFLVDDDVTRIIDFFGEIFHIQRETLALSQSSVVFFTFSIALTGATFWYALLYVGSKKTIVRTGYRILILIAVLTTGMVFLVPDTFPQAWYILAFPLSLTISCYLATARSMRWATIVLGALLAGVVVGQVLAVN